MTKPISVVAFGYKHGSPTGNSTTITFDLRKKIRNPWAIPELREKTGLDPAVQAFVASCGGYEAMKKVAMEYAKSRTTIYVGCHGGRHRSVAFASMIGKELEAAGYTVELSYRDLDKGDN